MRLHVPKELKDFALTCKEHGYQCFLVGGAVRDLLMRRTVKDFDLATNALPRQVMKLFKRVIPTGLQHGTVTVLYKKYQFEVTTFRIEGRYEDFRRPESVEYAASIDEDLKRRDFSINAIAYDLQTGTLLDPFHGREDIKAKIIRAIGNPEERLKEDALRTLRACRFACVFRFEIEEETLQAITRTAALINRISNERIRDELVKIIAGGIPSKGFELLSKVKLLHFIMPELEACRGVTQPAMHCFDVYFHSLYSCDAAPAANLNVRLAALLHDIGKPLCITRNTEGELRFFGHEKKSADMSRRILRRLKFPNAVINSVYHLILHHMWGYDDSWTDAAVRRFLRRVGPENINELFLLRKADQAGMCNRPASPLALDAFRRHIDRVLADAAALTVHDLAINGNDIKRELALDEGVYIGKILDFLLESVLDDPALNTHAKLLEMARKFYEQRLKPFLG